MEKERCGGGNGDDVKTKALMTPEMEEVVAKFTDRGRKRRRSRHDMLPSSSGAGVC